MRCILIVAVLALLTAPVLADTVYLKNGRKMVGKVTVTQDQVIIETELGMMAFSRKQVERIEKDDKTLKVPKKSTQIPGKGASERAWEMLPDMPYHHVAFADIEVGAKLVAYNPRIGLAIFGTVAEVRTVKEERTLLFEAPSKALFRGEDSTVFSFYKIDTDMTLAKLLFFGCSSGDEVVLGLNDDRKLEVVFRKVSGADVEVREGMKTPQNISIREIHRVENQSAKARALESYLKSKGMEEGGCFTFTERDGTVRMGKLVKSESGLVVESSVADLKLDWNLVDNIAKLDPTEYKKRTRHIKASKSTYDPAVKPGDKVRAAISAYGAADREGDGISGRIGVEGARALALFTSFFSKAGLWVSSRHDTIYEIETGDKFNDKIYGISLGAPLKEALAVTDIYFYRSNVNNPRIMSSDTLSPLKVELLLDSKMETVEKIRVKNPGIAGDWVVKAGVIMRRLDNAPGR